MIRFKGFLAMSVLAVALCGFTDGGCDGQPQTTSNSGVQQATVKVTADADGHTIEQKNIAGRLTEDNKPGAIKHLYIISPYSGQVIIYSTVKGKVTSGGKRLSPLTVTNTENRYPMPTVIDGDNKFTNEVIQDDGTYGSSSDYIYWWDTKGIYHQHFMTGGQIIHVTSQPLNVKSIIINVDGVSEK